MHINIYTSYFNIRYDIFFLLRLRIYFLNLISTTILVFEFVSVTTKYLTLYSYVEYVSKKVDL